MSEQNEFVGEKPIEKKRGKTVKKNSDKGAVVRALLAICTGCVHAWLHGRAVVVEDGEQREQDLAELEHIAQHHVLGVPAHHLHDSLVVLHTPVLGSVQNTHTP